MGTHRIFTLTPANAGAAFGALESMTAWLDDIKAAADAGSADRAAQLAMAAQSYVADVLSRVSEPAPAGHIPARHILGEAL